jgi:hypothetical protein
MVRGAGSPPVVERVLLVVEVLDAARHSRICVMALVAALREGLDRGRTGDAPVSLLSSVALREGDAGEAAPRDTAAAAARLARLC